MIMDMSNVPHFKTGRCFIQFQPASLALRTPLRWVES